MLCGKSCLSTKSSGCSFGMWEEENSPEMIRRKKVKDLR